mmetsp:Transcript_26979/g.59716  ORF Transcript_26979/g.59716 Transcript_26979/m.59716 type:complete len:89 (-) Transcript_26979:140-406(-)
MFPGTQKHLPYYEARNVSGMPNTIPVLEDAAGVLTIRDTGGPIEYCKTCDKGYFNIGAMSLLIANFSMLHAPVAAQPRIHSPCSVCRK